MLEPHVDAVSTSPMIVVANESASPGSAFGRNKELTITSFTAEAGQWADNAHSVGRVVIINDFSVAKGGGTALALLSAKLFRQLDIPVTYLCGDGGINPELDTIGVDVMPLGAEHILERGRAQATITGLHNAAARSMLDRWIAANDTSRTVYHVHGWSKIMSPSIFLALERVFERTLLHAHDFFLACPNGAFYDYQRHSTCSRTPLSLSCFACNCDKRSYPQKIWRAARSSRLRSVLLRNRKTNPRVLLLHDNMAPAFEASGYPREMLHTLRNPVIPYSGSRVRAEDNSTYFFVGRLEPEKGIEDAVAAAVKAAVPLTIIGDGPLREHLLQHNSLIQVMGWKSHNQIAGLISGARALLMPTRYPEPFGLVAAEASRSGIPVLLSNKAFLADEMVAAGIALSCDTSNIADFTQMLRYISAMPRHLLRAMSEEAYNGGTRIANSPEDWRDALINHYAQAIAEA